MISELALLWKLCIVALVAAAGSANALPLGEKDQEQNTSSNVLFLAGPAASINPGPTRTPTPTLPSPYIPNPTTTSYVAVSSDGDISINDPWTEVSKATSMDIEDPLPEVNGAPEAPIEMPEWTWTLTFFKERPSTTVESTDEYGHASTRTVTHYKVVSQKNSKGPKTATAAPTGASGSARPTTWTLKKDYGSDLAADIGIKTWAWGKSLVSVLPSLPPQTSSYSVGPQPTAYPYVDPAKNTDKVMQVIYPSGSVNPAARPQGGVGFYAAPSKFLYRARQPCYAKTDLLCLAF